MRAAARVDVLRSEYPTCDDPRALAKRLGISVGYLYTLAWKFGISRDADAGNESRAASARARWSKAREEAGEAPPRAIEPAISRTPLESAWMSMKFNP